MSLEVEIIPTGLLDVNTVILYDNNFKNAVIVDPGGDEDYLYKFLTKKELTLNSILHTHAHFDHISGTTPLINKYPQFNKNLKIYLHKEDHPLWSHPERQAAMFGIPLSPQGTEITDWLVSDSVLNFKGFDIKVLHTPGHSPGSCSFYIEKESTLISGDVIFQGSIGRTDLWRGNFDTLLKTIREKILVLPGNTKIISGHGPVTSVESEKNSNPFLTA